MVFTSDYSLCIPALRPYMEEPYTKMECENFDQLLELEPDAEDGKMWETPHAPSGPAFKFALSENLEMARLLEETPDYSGFFDSMGLDMAEPLLDNYYQGSSRCSSPIDFHHLVDPNLIQESSTGSGAQAALPSDSASSNENLAAQPNAVFLPIKKELPQITAATTNANLGVISNDSSATTQTDEVQVIETDLSYKRATTKPLIKIVGKSEITSADLNTGVCEPNEKSQILSRTAYSPQFLSACFSSYTNSSTNGKSFAIGRRVLPHNSYGTPVSLDVKASVFTPDVPKCVSTTNLVVQPVTSAGNRYSGAQNTATSFPVTVLSNSSTKSSFSITANKTVVSSCSMTNSWPNSVGTITTKSSDMSQSQRQQQHPSQNAVVYLTRNKEASRSSLQNGKPRGAVTPSSAARVTTVHPVGLTPLTSVESVRRISQEYSASEYSRVLEGVIAPPVSPPSYNNSASSSPVGGSSAEADYPMQTIAEPTPATMVSCAIDGSSSGNSSLVVKSHTEVAGLNLQPHFLPYPSSPDSEYEGTRYGSCKKLLTANNDPLLSSSSPLSGLFTPNPSLLATGVTNSNNPAVANQLRCTCISENLGSCPSHSPLICGRPTCTTYGDVQCSNSSSCLGHHSSSVRNLSHLATDYELTQEPSASYQVDDSTPMLDTTNSRKSHENQDSGMSSCDRSTGVSPNSMGCDSIDEGYPTSQPSSDTDFFEGNISENDIMGVLRWNNLYQLDTSDLMNCDSLPEVENSNELPQEDNNVSLEKPEVVKAMVYTTGDKEVKVGGIQVELQRADDVHTDHSYCRPDSPTFEQCQPLLNAHRRRSTKRGRSTLLGMGRQANSSRNLPKTSPSVVRNNFIRDCSAQPSMTTSIQNAKKTPVWMDAMTQFNYAHKRPSSMPGGSDVFAYCTRPTSDTSAGPPSKKRKNAAASSAPSSNGSSYSSGDEIDVIGVYGNGVSAPRPHPARRGRPPKAAVARGGVAFSRGTRTKTQVMGAQNLYMGALPTKGSPAQFGASPMRVASPIMGNSSPRVQSPLLGGSFVRVVSPIMGISPFGNTSPFESLRGASPTMGASAAMRVASPSFGSSSPRIASPIPRMAPDKPASSSRRSPSPWGSQPNASSSSRSIPTAKSVHVESTHGKRWKGKSAANSEIPSIGKDRAPCRQRTPSRKVTQCTERTPSRGNTSVPHESDVTSNTQTSRGRSGSKRGRPSKAASAAVSSGLAFSNWGTSPATKPRGGSRSNSRRAKSPEEIDLTGCDSPTTDSVRSSSKSTRGNSSSRGQKRGRYSSKTTSVARSRPNSPAVDVCGYPIDDPRLQIAPKAFRTEKGMLVHLGTSSSAPVTSSVTTSCGRSAGSRGGRGRGRGRGASRTALTSPLQDTPTFSNPGSVSTWAGSNFSAGGTFLPTGTYLSLGNRSSSVPSNDLLKPPSTFLLPRNAANKANGGFAADITRAYVQNSGRGRGGRKPAVSRTPRVTFCAETTTRRARGPNSRLDDQAKRKRHNTMERKRRNDIREAFDVLRQHLTSTDPRVKLEKLPKVRVLLAARRTFDDLTMAVADGSVTSRKQASRMQALTTVIRKMTRDDGAFKYLESVYHMYLTKLERLHREARHRNYVPLV